MNIFTKERKMLGLELKDIAKMLNKSFQDMFFLIHGSDVLSQEDIKKLVEIGFSIEASKNPKKEVSQKG